MSLPSWHRARNPFRTPSGALWAVVLVWAATRAVLLLTAMEVVPNPWPFVTGDARAIYREWFHVLRSGTFPVDDVRWQYPPGAAGVLLLPGLLPFDYATSVYLLMLVADAAVVWLLARGIPRGVPPYGAALWVVAVPLLGPIVLARYDLAVTAPTVAALVLITGRRADRHRLAGLLAGFATAIKLWPALIFVGLRGRRGPARAYAWTLLGAAVVVLGFTAALPGAFAFLGYQRERGIEVESVFAVPFHLASWCGWSGQVRESYGSLEFHGPYITAVGRISLLTSVLGFGWLLLWRVRARRFTATTAPDAALCAMLIFVTTSRVISPQYLVWLIGLAAVCLLRPDTTQRLPAVLLLCAMPLTTLEFPIWFGELLRSEPAAVLALTARNTLLVTATAMSARRLWQASRAVDEPTTAAPTKQPPTPTDPHRPVAKSTV
ncbi:glycosyltransferase 87 family protein [Embleya sp. NPDC020630]|uniref:glycosyltransferase 87 family protein n=1 Tax=Embleya sp. NPDC020630 TaxID=3363979 RepID=UPI0037B721DF